MILNEYGWVTEIVIKRSNSLTAMIKERSFCRKKKQMKIHYVIPIMDQLDLIGKGMMMMIFLSKQK